MVTIDLHGKVALVTGATGELGRTLVRMLARCGADVVVHYHQNEQTALSLQQEVVALGKRACVAQAELSDAAEVAQLASHAQAQLGAVDIVVANAVEQIFPWQTVLEEAVEDYVSQFRSSVLQQVLLAKAFVPGMCAKGWGRYIGINTECTMQMYATQSAYVTGKRAMDGLLRVLAREVGANGVTVNQVAPGWTVTERQRERAVDDSAYVRQVPLGRRGTDQEVANVVAFLASDLASFVHGAFVPVSGGSVMPCV